MGLRGRTKGSVMRRQLELVALALGTAGWFCAVLTRCVPLWNVSGTLDNATAALPAYWYGVWLEWDHWDLQQDGSLHCSFYQSLMSLSGSFRTWRALLTAAIGAGAFAVAVGVVGAVWFPKRVQVKVASGVVFVLSGVLMLIPIAWTCHHTGQPLEGAVALRRDWGAALYLGWISFALFVAGGGLLTTTISNFEPPQEEGDAEARYPGQELEVQHPLNTIQRTAFTNSQYRRARDEMSV